jgi:hypothetical protein
MGDDYELFIKNIENYCVISFGPKLGKGVPTVALIYDTKKLGRLKKIFCEDCKVAGQNGRPMLGVITNKDFGLISMHAPNVNPYLKESIKKLKDSYDYLKKLHMHMHIKEHLEKSLMYIYEYIDELDNYFAGKLNVTPEEINAINAINALKETEFMTPMVEKITNFIKQLTRETKKIVLMGDMNDPYPNKQNSLSNKLKKNLELQFSPDKPTCCYNWDSSKRDNNEKEHTNWFFGHGHPDDDINKKSIQDQTTYNQIKNKKSKKKIMILQET